VGHLYVSVTVHREQSVKREYQQDATIQMFIVNFRYLLSTTFSTCFGHHYTHHQENKDRCITAYDVCAGRAGCG